MIEINFDPVYNSYDFFELNPVNVHEFAREGSANGKIYERLINQKFKLKSIDGSREKLIAVNENGDSIHVNGCRFHFSYSEACKYLLPVNGVSRVCDIDGIKERIEVTTKLLQCYEPKQFDIQNMSNEEIEQQIANMRSFMDNRESSMSDLRAKINNLNLLSELMDILNIQTVTFKE